MGFLKFLAPLVVCVTLISWAYLYAEKIKYLDDGSIEVTDDLGKATRFSMDGITPYGEPVKEIRNAVYRDKFELEFIYSPELSDDILEGTVKQFYDNILEALRGKVLAMSADELAAAGQMKLTFSNCRFCKTGYCRRKNIAEISLVLYKNEKIYKEKRCAHQEIVLPEASLSLAVKLADELLK